MKKILALLLILTMMSLFSIAAFAHPVGPGDHKPLMPEAAAKGLHNAYANISDNENGVAAHVFESILSPH